MRLRTQLAALAAVTTLSGLAACGGGDEAASPEAESPEAESPEAAAPAQGGAPAAGGQTGGFAATITMTDNKFSPATLSAKPGAKISVVNEGKALHDLTDGKNVDSGDIEAGQSGSVTAPNAAGSYDYKCTYHFGMTGKLDVA